MKKILSVILAVMMLAGVIGLFSSCGESVPEIEASDLKGTYSRNLEGTTLKVYNWGEYISDGFDGSLNVNKAFEEITGIKVEYSNYDDNETMYSELSAGATYYDIIIPSDYMIERLIREDMLAKIDVSKLSNYDLIDSKYKNLFFDPDNEYSVPYNVGMVGLIYNKTLVEEEPTSWAALWDERYKDNILMFNNPRDAFAIAQFRLGQDLNTTDKADWDAAADLLIEQNPVLQSYVMDEVFNKMEGGNAALAPYYAGDYLVMKENNEDLGFVYPEEGVNIFVDSICIPKNTQNYDAAVMYVNFLIEPVIALANAEKIGYASPNTSVLNNEDYCYKDEPILYPEESEAPKTQWFHDLDAETLKYYEELWIKVKKS